MKTVYQIKKTYQELPANLKKFLIRGLILFIAWSLLYNLLLKPINIPDGQLTHFVVICTEKVLSLFYSNLHVVGADIFINGKDAIVIAPTCNGLEMQVLYIGFLLCLPTNRKRFWSFAIIGLILINILNIIRCALLAWMFYKDFTIADFAHHYIFKLIIFGFIFLMWMVYSKKYAQHETAK